MAWLVPEDLDVWTGADEPIVTFFLRLPETVGWPKGGAIRDLRKIDPRLHHILEPSREPSPESPGAGDLKYENLVRAHVIASSILMHQVPVDLGAEMGMDATMAAVAQGLPSAANPLAASESQTREELPEGWATVAEVAIPLQVLAATAAADQFDEDFSLPDPNESLALLDDALQAAIDAVARFQSSYHAVTRRPLTVMTRELLPPFVPYVVRTMSQIADKQPTEVKFLMTNPGALDSRVVPTIEPGQAEAVFKAGNRDPALLAYLDLHQQGSVSLFRRGNTREAVVMMAAAAEALLNIVLCHMRWEDGLTPEESALRWPQGLASRVKTLFPQLLGGDWDTTGQRPVGSWARDVAAVRHRVVHGGYLPSKEEAERSLESVEDLLGFIGDRLVYGRNLRRYPRTASELLNEHGLRRRNRYPQWLQALQEDPTEPAWHECFGAWYSTHLRLLADTDRPRTSVESRSQLLAVFTSARDFAWVLRDLETRRAAEAQAQLTGVDSDPVSAFRRFLDVAEGGAEPHFPISMALERSEDWAVTRTGPWVEDYHLCPLAGVMRDGSDYDAPWPLTAPENSSDSSTTGEGR